MKTYFLIILTIVPFPGVCQLLTIESGNLSVGENTTISLMQTSLVSNGEINPADSSLFVFKGGFYPISIEGNSEINTGNLKIDGTCLLNTNLEVFGNIIFSSGSLDLNNSDIHIAGILKGENENSRIFSTGTGSIITSVNLINGQLINPGNFGLLIIPSEDYADAEFIRAHEVQLINSSTSIARYYSIPQLDGTFSLTFNYFGTEVTSHDKSLLKLFVQTDNRWKLIDNSVSSTSENFVQATVNGPVEKISLFEFNPEEFQVNIPNGFSPNNDGENDVFIIEGALNFPNNRLSIINQWGDVLFETDGYINDWAGTNTTGRGSSKGTQLADGTYFYIFFKDKNDKSSVVRGFVEIKSGK